MVTGPLQPPMDGATATKHTSRAKLQTKRSLIIRRRRPRSRNGRMAVITSQQQSPPLPQQQQPRTKGQLAGGTKMVMATTESPRKPRPRSGPRLSIRTNKHRSRHLVRRARPSMDMAIMIMTTTTSMTCFGRGQAAGRTGRARATMKERRMEWIGKTGRERKVIGPPMGRKEGGGRIGERETVRRTAVSMQGDGTDRVVE